MFRQSKNVSSKSLVIKNKENITCLGPAHLVVYRAGDKSIYTIYYAPVSAAELAE